MKTSLLHLHAPDHWVNDPNGFLYYRGQYHLFYQYFPYAAAWGTMHWGHAVSRDLVHWQHQGLALFPTIREDQNGCFSGSAVEQDGEMVLFYTGVRYVTPNPRNIHLSLDGKMESNQLTIRSADGFSFDNWQGKQVAVPAITHPEVGDFSDTRDPKVWRGKNGWYLMLGSTVRREGRVLLYQSQDLKHWEYRSQAGLDASYGWMWECPNYVGTSGGEVLLVSAMGFCPNGETPDSVVACFPVHFREESCTMEISKRYQLLDYGRDLYAPQTTLDEQGRPVLIAWVRMPKPVEEGWIGMFSAPRLVEVRKGRICFPLHPNVRQACSCPISHPNQAHPAGYRARFSLEEGEWVNLGGFEIACREGRICTDRTAVYPKDTPGPYRCQTPALDRWEVEVLAEEHLVEVFVNDGEYTISNAVYGLGREWKGNLAGPVSFYTLQQK